MLKCKCKTIGFFFHGPMYIIYHSVSLYNVYFFLCKPLSSLPQSHTHMHIYMGVCKHIILTMIVLKQFNRYIQVLLSFKYIERRVERKRIHLKGVALNFVKEHDIDGSRIQINFLHLFDEKSRSNAILQTMCRVFQQIRTYINIVVSR